MSDNIRVLHLSTHNEECGIARYQEQFVNAMGSNQEFYNDFFEVSPNKSRFMRGRAYDAIADLMREKLKSYDILHIQHELSFYKHEELRRVIDIAHSMGKKVMVTVHTALDVEYRRARLSGVGPRSILHYVRTMRAQKAFEKTHIKPLLQVDLIVVHNEVTRNSLISLGYNSEKIKVIRIPVPQVSFSETSNEIKQALQYKDGDVLISTVGFISKAKGVDQAVKALTFLPGNYKLAIIGGLHPRGSDEDFLDEITDYVNAQSLRERVYITGYIEDDNRLNALIRETDICVYPYDKKYYSYVSSAALNNAFANHRAVVAYPTSSVTELNSDEEYIAVCKSPNYYELAREIHNIDVPAKQALSRKYAEAYAYEKEAHKFVNVYKKLMSKDL